jgi:hypothetical protein
MRNAKLKEVIEHHLPYEIRMLFETYGLAAAAPLGSSRIAFVEAFCIHARVLHEFLTGKKGTGGRAKEVTVGYQPLAIRRIDPKIIRLLSSHVAHLTLERSTDSGKLIRSDIRNMLLIALADELMELRRHLRPEFRRTWEIVVTGGGYRLDRPGRASVEIHPK